MSEDLVRRKKRLSEVGQPVLCPIWKTEARVIDFTAEAHALYDSPRAGGVFYLDEHSFDRFDGDDTRIKISRWIYDKNQLGEIGHLTYQEVRKIERQERLRIEQRMERLLRCFAELPSQVPLGLCYAGRKDKNRAEFQIIEAATECWSKASEFQVSEESYRIFGGTMQLPRDLSWLISAAVEGGWLEKDDPSSETRSRDSYIRLTPAGVQRLEELETKAVNSEQAFVAMWFDESVNKAYEKGIELAIRDSGYRPLRIDKKEHNNKIDDEIIAEIRRSRFIVCDFTCGLIEHGGKQIAIPRGGVYYEAGFAQGLGIPVIWMCRADHIEHVHFDTRQFNHITWRTPEELREKLRNRIGAVIGDGPLKDR